MADAQTCKLNRTWLLKTGIFALALLGFGVLSVYDAAVKYPRRGLEDASLRFKEFLVAADKAGYLTTDKITVANQREALRALEAKISDLRSEALKDTHEGHAAAMEVAKYEWLAALSRAWKLDAGRPELLAENISPPRRVVFDAAKGEGYAVDGTTGVRMPLSPQSLLNDLNAYWSKATPPSALSAYDLPAQWLFVVIGLGLGGYLVFLMLKCAAKAGKFRYEPETRRLTIPGGASLVPADLQDVDKRQWHKYFVTLVTSDGTHHRLDLLRYVPLEDWVLEMERTRFPERAEDQEREEESKPEEAAPKKDGE